MRSGLALFVATAAVVALTAMPVAAQPSSFREPAATGCDTVESCRGRCDKKVLAACRQLAQWYEDGDGIAADAARAMALYRRACDGNDFRACTMQGALLASGKPSAARDLAEAARVFKRACDGGDAYGCAQLGRILLNGEGTIKDAARGWALLDRTCKAGLVAGCQAAGDAADALGRPADSARDYRLACDGGNQKGCVNLGLQYESGKGVGADVTEAERLYVAACAGGVPVGCANAAVLLDGRHGLAADERRAQGLLEQACKGGDAPSCAFLKARRR